MASLRTCEDVNFLKMLGQTRGSTTPASWTRAGRACEVSPATTRAPGGEPEASYPARKMEASEHGPPHETCTRSSQLGPRERTRRAAGDGSGNELTEAKALVLHVPASCPRARGHTLTSTMWEGTKSARTPQVGQHAVVVFVMAVLEGNVTFQG